MRSASNTSWPLRSPESICMPHRVRLLASGQPLLTHGHERAHASLVARAPGLHAAPQPRFLDRQLLVELLPSDLLVRQPCVLLRHERRVVAGPRRQPPTVELDDARGEPLQKGPVVGHEHDRAAVVEQEILEPEDGVDIQVIGGLVQQQQGRGGHEGAREQHAPLPAAGQRADEHVRVEIEPRQHRFDPLLDGPAAVFLEFVLQLAQRRESSPGSRPRPRPPPRGGTPARGRADRQARPRRRRTRCPANRAARPGRAAPRSAPAAARSSPRRA